MKIPLCTVSQNIGNAAHYKISVIFRVQQGRNQLIFSGRGKMIVTWCCTEQLSTLLKISGGNCLVAALMCSIILFSLNPITQ